MFIFNDENPLPRNVIINYLSALCYEINELLLLLLHRPAKFDHFYAHQTKPTDLT